MPLSRALLCLVLPLASTLFASQARAASAPSPLEGAWQLVSGEYVDEAGKTVDYASLGLQGLKVLGDGHFAFTTTGGERFWAGGSGSYIADAGRYTEMPRLASYPLVEGGSYHFSYTLEGDTWTLERYEAGQRVEREVWRRAVATD